MRVALLAAVLMALVGCGSRSGLDDGGGQQTLTAWDENSPERTVAWIGARLDEINARRKPGNQVSDEEADRDEAEFVKSLTTAGHKVKWKVKLRSVVSDASVYLDDIKFTRRPNVQGDSTLNREDLIHFSPAGKGSTPGKVVSTVGGFFVAEGDREWIKDRAAGDAVVLTGTVVNASAKYTSDLPVTASSRTTQTRTLSVGLQVLGDVHRPE